MRDFPLRVEKALSAFAEECERLGAEGFARTARVLPARQWLAAEVRLATTTAACVAVRGIAGLSETHAARLREMHDEDRAAADYARDRYRERLSSQRAGDAGGRAETKPAGALAKPDSASETACLREEVSRLTAALAERTRERDEALSQRGNLCLAHDLDAESRRATAAEARLAEVTGEVARWDRVAAGGLTAHDAHQMLAAFRALALPATPPETKPETPATTTTSEETSNG